MLSKPLNDSLDNLFEGDTGPVRTVPVVDRPAAAEYLADKEAGYFEKCPRCSGTGQTRWGICFKCKGSKGRTFKTSPQERNSRRSRNISRKETRAEECWHAFGVEYPEAAGWIEANRATFGFAQAMRDAVERFGHLTEGQMDSVKKGIAREKARAAEKAKREASAPVADSAGVDRLKAAFDTAFANARARGRGLRAPRITIGGMVISAAKAESANAGALYVKNGSQYLGKIKGGRFFAVRECSPEQERRVLAFVADPKAAAVAYGKETGVCCVCNATLTNEDSIEAGIGPICAANFGW